MSHTDLPNLVACQLIMHNIAAPRRPSFLPSSLSPSLPLSLPVSLSVPLNQPNIVALSQTAPLDLATGNRQWVGGEAVSPVPRWRSLLSVVAVDVVSLKMPR